MLVVAHSGHWLLPVLYALPMLAVVGFMIVSAIRDRRRTD